MFLVQQVENSLFWNEIRISTQSPAPFTHHAQHIWWPSSCSFSRIRCLTGAHTCTPKLTLAKYDTNGNNTRHGSAQTHGSPVFAPGTCARARRPSAYAHRPDTLQTAQPCTSQMQTKDHVGVREQKCLCIWAQVSNCSLCTATLQSLCTAKPTETANLQYLRGSCCAVSIRQVQRACPLGSLAKLAAPLVYIRNPKPETQIPKPQTPNPKPQTGHRCTSRSCTGAQ